MNETNKSLCGINRTTRLTKGQLALYELILEANRDKFVISRQRLKTVYVNNVQRNKEYWNPWKERVGDKYRGGYEHRNEYVENINCMNWFTNALGALIKKGYLTVIPKFNLKKAKELSQ